MSSNSRLLPTIARKNTRRSQQILVSQQDAAKQRELELLDKIKKAFAQLDKNGTGEINAVELKGGMFLFVVQLVSKKSLFKLIE